MIRQAKGSSNKRVVKNKLLVCENKIKAKVAHVGTFTVFARELAVKNSAKAQADEENVWHLRQLTALGNQKQTVVQRYS